VKILPVGIRLSLKVEGKLTGEFALDLNFDNQLTIWQQGQQTIGAK